MLLLLLRWEMNHCHAAYNDASINDRSPVQCGLVILKWSWISCKEWKDMWFRRNLFFSDGSSICGDWQWILSPSQDLSFEHTGDSNQWAREELSPSAAHSEGATASQAQLVFLGKHCCTFSVEDLKSCPEHKSSGATSTSMKCPCHFCKSVPWSRGASLSHTLGILSGCNDTV